jgi:SAM-dependent methyltransferase
MGSDDVYTFTRYLSSKKSVDDRSLNRPVFRALSAEVAAMSGDGPLRILEIGSGIGTMVERSLDWGLFSHGDYTALDAQPGNSADALARLPVWAGKRGYQVSDETPERLRLTRQDSEVLVNVETADVFDFIHRSAGGAKWDLLIANAFLDLVDVPSSLRDIFSLLKPGGLFYFTITFDGATILQPEIDPLLDAQIEALYHQTMDRRIIQGKPSGDSKTGRHFFQVCRTAGAEILAAGASDWVVFGGREGYPADEAFFLHFIVHTMGSALEGHPDLDQQRLSQWVKERHEQVEQGTLVYIAHQMDFFGRI